MKTQHYLDRIEKTEDYKKFMKSDPKAYLCSIFFVRDYEENHNETQVDFYSPKIKKILSILHVMDGRTVWNCTCFLKGLGLLQAHVEDESETILFMEKKNFLDIVKFVGTGGQTSLLEKPKKESKSKKKK